MKNREKGSASTLVIIMVFCFSTILFGSYLTSMSLQKSQQKSDLKMQEIYGDDISKVDEIYAQIINKKEIVNENITYNWKNEYEWGTGTKEDPKYYKTIIYITNHGETQDNWEINFDVQPGIIIQNCNVWSASSVEANENTITMKCQSWNAQIREGNTLMVDFILAFDNAQDLNIDNLKFNGEIIKKE